MQIINEFMKKSIINSLNEYNILAIMNNEKYYKMNDYNFYLLYKGILSPVWITYIDYQFVNGKFVECAPVLSDFIERCRIKIQSRIDHIDNFAPLDKNIEDSKIVNYVSFLESLVISQLKSFGIDDLISQKIEQDFSGEFKLLAFNMFQDGKSFAEVYDKIISSIGFDINEVIELISNKDIIKKEN